ncbi:MAG: STAS domain-containing protein [Rectinemataceae bacterium]
MSQNAERLEALLASFMARHSDTKLSSTRIVSPPRLSIAVDGVLDTQNSGDFQAVMVQAFETAKEYGGLVLELSRLNYISSTGVGALTTLLVEAQRHSIPFQLCRISEQVRSILDILGFTSFFPLFDDRAEAE